MTFIDLDTEEANDIIEVRDGTEKDYVLGQFSGSKDVKLMQPIFSTTKGLWVKFQSNFVNSSKGFKALITAGNMFDYSTHSFPVMLSHSFEVILQNCI